jgi:hypothetical protein
MMLSIGDSPWERNCPEKLGVSELPKHFSTSYEILMITTLKKALPLDHS